MEQPLERMPSKITNTHLKFHILISEIESQIVQFTDLPIDTPSLDLLAQEIVQQFVLLHNFFTAETVTLNPIPDDLLEIQHKILNLEAEFYQANLRHHVNIDHIDHEDDVSENSSVCESCLNDDDEFQGEALSDVLSVHEIPELLDEDEVPEDVNVRDEETTSFGSKRENIGKRQRRRWWWWRTVVILMPASVVWAVCYYEKRQQEGFLVPT